ncbi:MAG: GAF domain-containing protein [Bacteroidetes bacterium]|nr:GAF domain-containing protein [Bacteroidota bacterium]
MEPARKKARYSRLFAQLQGLMNKTANPDARMATVVAVLHNKMEYFYWTGFYMLAGGELIVRTYQGPLACQVLKTHTGVCWAAIDRKETIVVPDVHKFPGHIACDSASKSEIVIPLKNKTGRIMGVLDADSRSLDSFDAVDAHWLEKIVTLIY